MAMTRRGLSRGCSSEPFAGSAVERVLRDRDQRRVYVEPVEGRLAAAGGRSLADVAVAARMAESRTDAGLLLALAPAPASPADGPAGLRLSASRDLAPHDELLLWPDDDLLALLRPHLALANVIVEARPLSGVAYSCRSCGAAFASAQPLERHVLLRCDARDDTHAFWRTLLRALAPPRAASPSALEALATAWGRVPAGHLCLYCGKVYSRRYGLKIHIRTHTGHKPLRCRHCARRFGDPSNLNKHLRLHRHNTTTRDT